MFKLRYKPKHKTFDYKPMYYDQEKEELQLRLAKYKDNPDAEDVEKTKYNIRSGLRSSNTVGTNAYKKGAQRSSNMRLLAIIVILCFVVYMILQSDQIIKMMERM